MGKNGEKLRRPQNPRILIVHLALIHDCSRLYFNKLTGTIPNWLAELPALTLLFAH